MANASACTEEKKYVGRSSTCDKYAVLLPLLLYTTCRWRALSWQFLSRIGCDAYDDDQEQGRRRVHSKTSITGDACLASL